MTTLRSLQLALCYRVSPEAVLRVVRHLPLLEKLDLSGLKLWDSLVAAFLEVNPSLRVLNLTSCTGITANLVILRFPLCSY